MSIINILEQPVTQQDIDALNPWFYPMTVDGINIEPGIYPEEKADRAPESLSLRQLYRRQLLIDEVCKRFDFKGKRILDVACNCGYWSSIYLSEYGARSVVGVEGRSQFIEQAGLLYRSLGIDDRATFIKANVMEIDYMLEGSPFDFVLCAGILYHVLEPELLIKKIAAVNSDTMVLDTRVGSGQIIDEPRNLCFNAIDATSRKIIPKQNRLVQCVKDLGYDVEILVPPPEPVVDGEELGGYVIGKSDSYVAGHRICMICKRK